MLNLIIDIGNTRTKAAIFKGRTLLRVFYFDTLKVKNIQSLLKKYPAISASIVSNVSGNEHKLITYLQSKTQCIQLSYRCKLPLKLKYKTPHSLGNDRLAAAAAVAVMYPKKNCLIIDAGTCIKYDFVSSKAEYKGGAIAPGINMQLKALNTFTERLPLLKPKNKVPLTGYDTQTSILSGVINGSVAQASGIIEQYAQKHRNLTVIITGGDASYFENTLKTRIFVEPHLVLVGLNEILLINV